MALSVNAGLRRHAARSGRSLPSLNHVNDIADLAQSVRLTVIAVILRTPVKRSQNSTYLATDTRSEA
jgi:hypothetical protein